MIERILLDNDLTEGVVVRYLSHLLSALDCMHSMNIAHLDIKVYTATCIHTYITYTSTIVATAYVIPYITCKALRDSYYKGNIYICVCT